MTSLPSINSPEAIRGAFSALPAVVDDLNLMVAEWWARPASAVLDHSPSTRPLSDVRGPSVVGQMVGAVFRSSRLYEIRRTVVWLAWVPNPAAAPWPRDADPSGLPAAEAYWAGVWELERQRIRRRAGAKGAHTRAREAARRLDNDLAPALVAAWAEFRAEFALMVDGHERLIAAAGQVTPTAPPPSSTKRVPSWH